MEKPKFKLSKLVTKGLTKQTPLQLIRRLRQVLHPVKFNIKHQTQYVARMVEFGMGLIRLPMEFRHVLVTPVVASQLLESLAMLCRHKQSILCIFQMSMGIDNPQISEIIKQQLLPLLEIILMTCPTDVAVQLATIALLRQIFKYHSKTITQKQLDMMVKLLVMIEQTSTVNKKLALETLSALQRSQQQVQFY